MKDVKFVYFDIGGVLVKDFTDKDRWLIQTADWGIPDDKKNEVSDFLAECEKEIHKGKKLEDFSIILKDKFGVKIPDNFSYNQDYINKFVEKNPQIADIVKQCKEKYKIGLLTNMGPGNLELLMKNKLLPEINWDVIIDSSIVKCKKPEEKIYFIAQKKAGVGANEILFIDNRNSSVETANSLGWKTFLYDSTDYEKSNKELKEYLET